LVAPAFAILRLAPPQWLSGWKEISQTRAAKALGAGLSVVLMLGLIWAIFGRLMQARWGIIDDHEIMWFLGKTGKLALSEIPSRMAQTEIGSFGAALRYRPMYYLLRLLETAAWGDNPHLWYAARIGLFAAGALVLWGLARRVMGNLGAALLIAYTLSIPIWGDIVGRLGTPESYAVFGLPLFLAGMFVAFGVRTTKLPGQILPAALLSLGGVICVGAKEDFLILGLPTAYMAYLSVRRKQWLLLASAAAVLIVSGIVASSVLIATTKSGVDTYGRSVSILGRVGLIVQDLLERRLVSPFTMLVLLTVGIGSLHLLPFISKAERRAIVKAQAWLGVLILVYLSEWVFYNGDWPSLGTHYDFPGLLYLPAVIVILYWLALRLAPVMAQSDRMIPALGLSLLAALSLTVAFHRGFSRTSVVLRGYVAATIAFSDNLQRLVELLQQEPDLQLVVEGSGSAWLDFEPIVGFSRYLDALGVANPVFVRLHGYRASDLEPGHERNLATRLERTSFAGDGFYSPLPLLEDSSGDCLSVFVGESFPTRCDTFEWRGWQGGMPRLR
jgi:hypothetical protein